MANYSLVIDSKFQPFTYDEMLKPVLLAQEAHQEIENQYADLATKANIWEEMADAQNDPRAYSLYKKYSDDLSAQADILAREGLNAGSRKAMLNLKSRYSKEITPIEQAYTRRQQLADEQRKALAANPTLMYERNASTMSLDDFINNPSMDYGRSYSGAMLTKQVSDAAANLAKEARDSEQGRRRLRQLLPYQYELIQQNGFSREAVAKAIAGSSDADRILTGLVDDAILSSGIGAVDANGNPIGEGWGDLATRRRALDYARQGLYSSIGDTKYSMLTDQAGLINYKHGLENPPAPPAGAPSLNVRHWEGTLDENPAATSSVYNTIQTLSSLYHNSVSGKGKTLNPMKVYEEMIAYAKEHPVEGTTVMHTPRGPYYMSTDNDPIQSQRAATEYIKKKYGIDDVISDTDYKNLQTLGYNSDSASADFASQSMSDKYNQLSQIYRATSVNTANIEYPASTIKDAMIADPNTAGKMYKRKANGSKGEDVDLEEVFGDSGTINDIAYSAKEPDMIGIRTSTGYYYVSPDYFSAEAGDIVRQAKDIIENPSTTNEDKAKVQDIVAAKLEAIFNAYNPTRSKTSSKR